MPAAGLSAPSRWIRPAGILIDLSTLLANGDCRSAVSLIGCYEFDAAVSVPVVVAAHELSDPLTVLLFGGKGLAAALIQTLSNGLAVACA